MFLRHIRSVAACAKHLPNHHPNTVAPVSTLSLRHHHRAQQQPFASSLPATPVRCASTSSKSELPPPSDRPAPSGGQSAEPSPVAGDAPEPIVDDGSTAALLAIWQRRLAAEHVPEVDSSLRNILAHVLRQRRLDLSPECIATIVLSPEQRERFAELCECRLLRMPVQYIVGEWDFRELTLQMRPPVFIPRPETEELVELVLQQFDVKRAVRFAEIGSGSGAISIALLRALPRAQGVAIDQSLVAVELTQANAERHGVNERLSVRREKLTRDSVDKATLADAANAIGAQDDVLYDLIVSNPPYVPNGQIPGLEPEVKIYEDLRALDGGPIGLDTIETILWLASRRLRPVKGVLWLEVDPSHPALIQRYLEANAEALRLKWVASYADMFGKDRFVEIVHV